VLTSEGPRNIERRVRALAFDIRGARLRVNRVVLFIESPDQGKALEKLRPNLG
jgi:hypothetical protein